MGRTRSHKKETTLKETHGRPKKEIRFTVGRGDVHGRYSRSTDNDKDDKLTGAGEKGTAEEGTMYIDACSDLSV